MESIPIQNILIIVVIAAIISGLVILIVSSLNLGLRVRGFGSALITAIVITILGTVVSLALGAIGVPNPGGVIGFVERLIVSIVVLMLADKLLKGLTVYGLKGAVIASLALSVISWVLGLFLTAMGIPVPV